MFEHLVGCDTTDEFTKRIQTIPQAGGDQFSRRHHALTGLENQHPCTHHGIHGSIEDGPVTMSQCEHAAPKDV